MHTQIFQTDRFIEVTTRKEGIHCYPEAGTSPELKDVSFLAHPHRHIFHFRLKVSVDHNNRDIEFIQLKRWLESNLDEGYLNHKSCEMLAEGIIHKVHEAYPKVRFIEVGVSEDGENGAVLSTSYDIDRSVVSEPIFIEDSCDARLNIEVKGTQTSSLAEKVLDSLEDSDKYINLSKSQDLSLFESEELEGKHEGLKTLFVSGDVPMSRLTNCLQTQYDQVCFGAKDLCVVNLDTVDILAGKFPDVILTVETDSFYPKLFKLLRKYSNVEVMYRLVDSGKANIEGMDGMTEYLLRNLSIAKSLSDRVQVKVKHSFGVNVTRLSTFSYSSFDGYGIGKVLPLETPRTQN